MQAPSAVCVPLEEADHAACIARTTYQRCVKRLLWRSNHDAIGVSTYSTQGPSVSRKGTVPLEQCVYVLRYNLQKLCARNPRTSNLTSNSNCIRIELGVNALRRTTSTTLYLVLYFVLCIACCLVPSCCSRDHAQKVFQYFKTIDVALAVK